MIPQFLQEIMGYTAMQAGMVLSLGGLVLILLLPIVGFLGQKLDPRAMICFGFAWVSFGIWRISSLNLNIGFWDAASWRVIMVIGMPFLFVPISVMSYVGVPQEKNNEVSGLTALARNIGGSLGISFISTMLVRRAQVHQNYLAANVYPSSTNYRLLNHAFGRMMQSHGYSPTGAASRSMAHTYEMMVQQANVLAYIDTIHALVILTVCLIPIGYLMKKPRFRSRETAPVE
jgi:DHA2 family multidrug resistance protein